MHNVNSLFFYENNTESNIKYKIWKNYPCSRKCTLMSTTGPKVSNLLRKSALVIPSSKRPT